MPVLSERALEGLKEYRYKAAGYTILDRLHQPALDCALRTFHEIQSITFLLNIFLILSYLLSSQI